MYVFLSFILTLRVRESVEKLSSLPPFAGGEISSTLSYRNKGKKIYIKETAKKKNVLKKNIQNVQQWQLLKTQQSKNLMAQLL